ncbi:hypothetical protein [Holospora curviuscula]|nr:hypothetical protein [Holospora curviuscula]
MNKKLIYFLLIINFIGSSSGFSRGGGHHGGFRGYGGSHGHPTRLGFSSMNQSPKASNNVSVQKNASINGYGGGYSGGYGGAGYVGGTGWPIAAATATTAALLASRGGGITPAPVYYEDIEVYN